MEIAVLTPYGRNEVTAAALRVAETAVANSFDCAVASLGTHEQRVHNLWDHRVLSSRRRGVERACRGARYCIWFDWNAPAMAAADLVAPKAKHILVLRLQSDLLNAVSSAPSGTFDALVCPSEMSRDVAKQGGLHRLAARKRLLTIAWSCGLTPLQRDGHDGNRPLRILFHCDASSIDEAGLRVLWQAQEAMDLEIPGGVEVTLLSVKSWSRRHRQLIRQLRNQAGSRLRCEYLCGWPARLRYYWRSDWVWLAGVRGDFCLTAREAMSCGAIVSGYQISPLTELVQDGHNGILAPCEAAINSLSASIACPTAASFAPVLHAWKSPDVSRRIRATDWGLQTEAQAFANFWTDLCSGA